MFFNSRCYYLTLLLLPFHPSTSLILLYMRVENASLKLKRRYQATTPLYNLLVSIFQPMDLRYKPSNLYIMDHMSLVKLDLLICYLISLLHRMNLQLHQHRISLMLLKDFHRHMQGFYQILHLYTNSSKLVSLTLMVHILALLVLHDQLKI